jgi:hypothetical protein
MIMMMMMFMIIIMKMMIIIIIISRNKNDLKNETKIVQTISKDTNMNFALEKCARICLKRGRVESKVPIGNTF